MLVLIILMLQQIRKTSTSRQIRSSSSLSSSLLMYEKICGFRTNNVPSEDTSLETVRRYVDDLKTCRTYLENETRSIKIELLKWKEINLKLDMAETYRILNDSVTSSTIITTTTTTTTAIPQWIRRLNNTLDGKLSSTYYTSQLVITTLISLAMAFFISRYFGSEISRRAVFSWASSTLSPRRRRKRPKLQLKSAQLPKLFRGKWHHDCDDSLRSLLRLVLQRNDKTLFLGYTAADLAVRLFREENLSVVEGITTSSAAVEFWNTEHSDLLEKYEDNEER